MVFILMCGVTLIIKLLISIAAWGRGGILRVACLFKDQQRSKELTLSESILIICKKQQRVLRKGTYPPRRMIFKVLAIVGQERIILASCLIVKARARALILALAVSLLDNGIHAVYLVLDLAFVEMAERIGLIAAQNFPATLVELPSDLNVHQVLLSHLPGGAELVHELDELLCNVQSIRIPLQAPRRHGGCSQVERNPQSRSMWPYRKHTDGRWAVHILAIIAINCVAQR